MSLNGFFNGLFIGGILIATASSAAPSREIQNLIEKNQWNDAAETAYEILSKTPKDVNTRFWGAYALFQKGYSNAALHLLKNISPQDWKNLPQGQDRLVEVISLFQKKVPLTLLPGRLEQLNVDDVSPQLQEEVRYAKGRVAYERGFYPEAKRYLEAVSSRSRFYAQSKYILATIAVKQADYKTANAEFSKIFESAILDRSTEFWKDLNAQTSHHWGTSLHVSMDASGLLESKRLGELALMALARISYASKDYETALSRYNQILKDPQDREKVALEKIWTLLALNRHDESQKAAAELSTSGQGFETLHARMLRALVLVDIGRSVEARSELESFQKAYGEAKKSIEAYEVSGIDQSLPAFLRKDLALDTRLQTMIRYKNALLTEIASLRKEDPSLFPVFSSLANQLEPLVNEASASIKRGIRDHIYRRRSDLEALYLQSQLILAETYLEDREKLRSEYREKAANDPKLQQEHDQRLVNTLAQAVKVVDGVIERSPIKRTRLEFRQSELLWELSGARGVVAQTNEDKKEQLVADETKKRSIRIAREVVEKHPEFENHAQAMFFLGFAEMQLDKNPKTLLRYVEKYKKHQHVPDAYRILADLKFDENQFAAAEIFYRKILEFPASPVVGYAFYKIGWCAYQLKDYGKALLALEKATQWAVRAQGESHTISLRKESRHDLVGFYAEVGDHKKAHEYFSNVFQGEAPSWLADLAKELNRIGQYEKSIDLYHTLIAIEPDNEENIARVADMLRGEYALRRWPGVISTSHDLIQKYQQQLITPKAEEAPSGQAEKALREVVLSQLFEHRRAPSQEIADRIHKLDADYLAAFSAWPASQEPLYQHAHFLLSKKDFVGASKYFRQHWNQFRDSLKESLKEEAIRNLIFAMDQCPDGEKKLEEIVAATVEYEQLYPKSKFARSVLFLRSTILFKQQRDEQGIVLSQALFDENPADDIGKSSFKNLRVAYENQKDSERVYRWSSKLLESDRPGMKLYTGDLKTIREEALFLWADKTTENDRSAELYLKIADDPQMSRLHGKALYNAFVRYQSAGNRIAALETANRLQKSVPDFDMLPDLSGVRAAYYQEAGDYDLALKMLEIFLRNPPKQATKDTLLQARFNYALILEAKDQRVEANRAYEDFVRQASAESSLSGKVQEAKRGLDRLERPSKRVTALAPFPSWQTLEKARADYDRKPVPAQGDLPTRIKKGAEQLEGVANQFIQVSNSKQTPIFYAMEAYCTLPFLYSSYVKGLRALPVSLTGLLENEVTELSVELEKIAEPIQAKIKTLADQCLSKSEEVEHVGPVSTKVNQTWGWMADAKLKELTQQMVGLLQKNWPWLDEASEKNATDKKTAESKLIQLQYQKKDSEESWYALSMLRWKPQSYPLSRLTLVDTLNRYPNSGRTLNALVCVEAMNSPDQRGLAPLFEKAGEKGSSAAWANLAHYHLKEGRLGAAMKAFSRGLEENSFNRVPDLKNLVKELVKK